MSLWATKTLGEFVTLQRGHDLTEPDRRPGLVPVMTELAAIRDALLPRLLSGELVPG